MAPAGLVIRVLRVRHFKPLICNTGRDAQMIKLQGRLMSLGIAALFVVGQVSGQATPSAQALNLSSKNPWWIPASIRQTVVQEEHHLHTHTGDIANLLWSTTPRKTSEDPEYMHAKAMIDQQFRNHTLASHYNAYENEYASAMSNPILFFRWAYATFTLAVSESPHHYAGDQSDLIFAAFTTLPSPHVRAYEALRLICTPFYVWNYYNLTTSPKATLPFPPQGLQLAWRYQRWPQLLEAVCSDYSSNLKDNQRLVKLMDRLKPVYGHTIWYKEELADLYYVRVNGQMAITPIPAASVARYTANLYNEAMKQRKRDPEEIQRENIMRDPNNIGTDVVAVYGVYVRYPTIAPRNYKVPKGALPLSAYKSVHWP
jgi:hypothetical protein